LSGEKMKERSGSHQKKVAYYVPAICQCQKQRETIPDTESPSGRVVARARGLLGAASYERRSKDNPDLYVELWEDSVRRKASFPA
jgi:hypothetical protein